jgi:transposase
MDERVRFVGRLLDGEKMVALCREFAISRKTGYKIFDRYKEYGLEALTDRSRRPWRYANQLPQQVEAAILNLKREKPYWGARKIRAAPSTPCSIVTAWSNAEDADAIMLKARPCRWGKSPTSYGAPTTKESSCGATKKYCYPLTVTDHASRYL